MARQTPDGLLKVYWATTIADPAEPTPAEIAAAVDLTPFIAPAGILTPDEGSEADSSDLASVRDKSVPSTVSGNVEAELYRDDTTDTAWDALARGTAGFLISAPFGGSGINGVLANGDMCEVWGVRVSNRNPNRYARGDVYRFTCTMTVDADPIYNAEVTTPTV